MPDLAQVARLLPMRSQCEASIQDLVQKKLIMGIGRDGETTIDITVDGRAWGHALSLPTTMFSPSFLTSGRS
jgi:hypothetical protein